MSSARGKGFTLLEMMLVILLIGIASSMVVSTLPDRSGYNIMQQSQRLADRLQWLSDTAIIRGDYYGLSVTPQHWQLLVLQKNQRSAAPSWQPLDNPRFLTQQELPDSVSLLLRVEGVESPRPSPDSLSSAKKTASQSPQVILSPSGEIVPFSLLFLDSKRQTQAEIYLDSDGSLRWGTPQSNEEKREKK